MDVNGHERLRIKQTQTLKSTVLLKLKTDQLHWGLAYISDYDIGINFKHNAMHSQKPMNCMNVMYI